MSVPRLFLDEAFSNGARLPLDEEQARYLLSVLRLSDGAMLRVFNARDGDWSARLIVATKKKAELQLERMIAPMRATVDLMLLFAPVKRHATDLIVEKATELGVRIIQPVTTRRTNADSVRLDRWRAIAREAAEQSERTDLPIIGELASLAQILGAWDVDRALVYADELGEEPDKPWGGTSGRASAAMQSLGPPSPAKMALLIGPEGGFEPDERAFLRSLAYVRPVSLGPRILRAETAVIAGLTLIQACWGDWR